MKIRIVRKELKRELECPTDVSKLNDKEKMSYYKRLQKWLEKARELDEGLALKAVTVEGNVIHINGLAKRNYLENEMIACALSDMIDWDFLKGLKLTKHFNQKDYPAFDNYCAFNVDRCEDIPIDDEIEIEIPDEDFEKWKSTYGDDLEIVC